MKKEIKRLLILQIILCITGLICLFFHFGIFDILVIKWFNKNGTYNTFKPLGSILFVILKMFELLLVKERTALKEEFDIYEKFLNE